MKNSKHSDTFTVGFSAYVLDSNILCGGWKVSSFLLGTTACRIGDYLTSVKIHTHKPGAVPKDFSALPIFTTVNIAVDDKSENE